MIQFVNGVYGDGNLDNKSLTAGTPIKLLTEGYNFDTSQITIRVEDGSGEIVLLIYSIFWRNSFTSNTWCGRWEG